MAAPFFGSFGSRGGNPMGNRFSGNDYFVPGTPVTGGPLPMFAPDNFGTQTAANAGAFTPPPPAGSAGYGTSPFVYNRPDGQIGTGREQVRNPYFTPMTDPMTKTFDWQGNQYTVNFAPGGLSQSQVDKFMTNYAGTNAAGDTQRVFNPTSLLRQYYAQMNNPNGTGRELPFTVNFAPGSEGAVNPFVRQQERRVTPGQLARGLLG